MLIINDKKMELVEQEIKLGNYFINGEEGYDIGISLKFITDNKEGYIYLSAGYELEKDIDKFLNRTFKGIPYTDIKEEINLFEVFDTENFYDTEIESEICLNIKGMLENNIEVNFEVKDELINIKFEGLLNIIK